MPSEGCVIGPPEMGGSQCERRTKAYFKKRAMKDIAGSQVFVIFTIAYIPLSQNENLSVKD